MLFSMTTFSYPAMQYRAAFRSFEHLHPFVGCGGGLRIGCFSVVDCFLAFVKGLLSTPLPLPVVLKKGRKKQQIFSDLLHHGLPLGSGLFTFERADKERTIHFFIINFVKYLGCDKRAFG